MLSVHLLPELVQPAALTGTVVVIDILRASTVIARALASGAADVFPCLEVDEARQQAAQLPAGMYLLGGEREGLRIDGFHCGNSPCEYSSERVRGKRIIFTTTNGTKALKRCQHAAEVLIGSFVNAAAIVSQIAAAPRIHLLCAGTRGEITHEDTLFAGLVVERLSRRGPCELANDEARLAHAAWRAAFGTDSPAPADLARELRDTQGGRNLARIGLDSDILDVAQLDSLTLVPHLDPARRVIVA